MDNRTKIQSRTGLISLIERKKLNIGAYKVREILEQMYHGEPTYITYDKEVFTTHSTTSGTRKV